MTHERETLSSYALQGSLAQTPNQEFLLFPHPSPRQMALQDVKDGLSKWPIWLMLAYQDIKLRYRRSVLGPFWITISMAITVYSMGFLYAHLFHADLAHYFPYLVSGMLGWSFLSSLVIDTGEGFGADGYIKQIKLPYSLYLHRIVARNMIIFFHNILVIIPILIIYHEAAKINFHTLFLFPALFIIYCNALAFGTVLAMIGSRFRDISQVIKNLVQVIFFVTPIMWGPDQFRPDLRFIIDLNPFYAFLELIRAPLLGNLPTLKNAAMVGACTIVSFSLSTWMFIRYRSRIVYWI